MSLFVPNVTNGWDGHIKMQNVIGQLDIMELIAPLPCGDELIKPSFRWNGASVGVIRYLGFLAFPKWKHPIATCRHDKRCAEAETWAERLFADDEFSRDVAKDGTPWERTKGFSGVRIGAAWWWMKKRFKG